MESPLIVIPSNFQHIGNRDNQEDAFAFSDLGDQENVLKNGILAIVADGMGGMEHGEQASQVAVNVFLHEYEQPNNEEDPIPQKLLRPLTLANVAVYDLALDLQPGNEPGTTLIAVVVHRINLYWVSVGDSRLYLYRKGALEKLNIEHTFANYLQRDVERGMITRKEAAEHPERDFLTSYLGLPELKEIDYNSEPLPLQPYDRILLCSDGLNNTISDRDIAEILSTDHSNVAEELVIRALNANNPHQDNVTAMVLTCMPG